MKAAKAVAPYLFVLACIIVFVPLPVWSANTVGFLALVNPPPPPPPPPEPEPEPPPKAFDDDDKFSGAFVDWVTKHRDQGKWMPKHETRPGRFFLVDFRSDSRGFSGAEKLAQKIIDAWMANGLDPYTKDVTLIVTTTRVRKKGSPTKRDVYVPTDAVAYNPDTDRYEDAMNLLRQAKENFALYDWGLVIKPRLLPLPDRASK